MNLPKSVTLASAFPDTVTITLTKVAYTTILTHLKVIELQLGQMAYMPQVTPETKHTFLRELVYLDIAITELESTNHEPT